MSKLDELIEKYEKLLEDFGGPGYEKDFAALLNCGDECIGSLAQTILRELKELRSEGH